MTDMRLNRATVVPAHWTPDCSGKQDYDGEILSISTRYWPRGGSATIFNNGRFESDGSNPQRQRTIPPSASSSIILHVGPIVDYDPARHLDGHAEHAVTLAEREFEGETEEEVKGQVEAWAAEQYARIVAALRVAFAPPLADQKASE
jgi:hypothetical protein